MKKSKLLKLITLPTLATVIGITPLTLCQCSQDSQPSIDPSVSSKVNISTTTDKDGNSVNTLTTKSTSDKITDVSVSIGSNLLTKDTDYSVSGLSTNSESVVVTIFKATLSKYSGSIVIKPSINTTVTLTSITCSQTSITKEVGGTVKAKDITVTGIYSNSTTKTLTWNTDYKVYNGSVEQTNFGTGITFTSTGTTTFTIKAVEDETKTTKLTVKVNPQQVTITFRALNGTVSTTTKPIDKGTTWGNVTKPTATPAYGYVNSVIWRNGSSSGSEMQSSDPINSNMTIYACFESERTTAEGGTKEFDTYNEAYWESYIPSENSSDTGTYKVKRASYNNDTQYTFQIALDGSTITDVRYFWIYQLTSSSGSDGRLFPFQNTTKNIVSVMHGSDKINYTIRTASNGKYLDLNSTFTSGTIKIIIAFHEDQYVTSDKLSFIPAFETTK